MDDFPTKSATGFLVAWMLEHLAKQGLIDGTQLLLDLQSVVEHPEAKPEEQQEFERWIRELRSYGVLPTEGEQQPYSKVHALQPANDD